MLRKTPKEIMCGEKYLHFPSSQHSNYIAKWIKIRAFGFQIGIGRGFDFIRVEFD